MIGELIKRETWPFNLGEGTIYSTHNAFWPDFVTVSIEFEHYPQWNFKYRYSNQARLYIMDEDALALDFVEAWVKHFRSVQVEPPENVVLGED